MKIVISNSKIILNSLNFVIDKNFNLFGEGSATTSVSEELISILKPGNTYMFKLNLLDGTNRKHVALLSKKAAGGYEQIARFSDGYNPFDKYINIAIPSESTSVVFQVLSTSSSDRIVFNLKCYLRQEL